MVGANVTDRQADRETGTFRGTTRPHVQTRGKKDPGSIPKYAERGIILDRLELV